MLESINQVKWFTINGNFRLHAIERVFGAASVSPVNVADAG
jgi:hypothetical protein